MSVCPTSWSSVLRRRGCWTRILLAVLSSGDLLQAISGQPPLGLLQSYRILRHKGIIEQPEAYHGVAVAAWHPFFNSGYSRKRHASSGLCDGNIRTVSASYAPRPTLLNGRAVQPRIGEEDEQDPVYRPSPPVSDVPPRRKHKLRQSLGSIRRNGKSRNFTDPTTKVFKEDVQGSILPTGRPYPLSPVSRSSTFDFDMPHGTPVFTSSPPMQYAPRSNPIVSKRGSVTLSDPNTLSSENDTRIFTDDESMDFRSDTAYDSLATRATASSHSGFRQSKIETIFDEPSKETHQWSWPDA